MKVKDLIIRLLDEPMNADVKVGIKEEHDDGHGGTASGYVFMIDDVEHWSKDYVIINFTDWRKDDE